MSGLVGLGLIVIAFGLYWLPSIIALDHRHAKLNSILVINFFLGLTLIGWVVALAMAVDKTNWGPKRQYRAPRPGITGGHNPSDPSTYWPPAANREASPPAQLELPKF
jgi:T4 superinfection immunity protein